MSVERGQFSSKLSFILAAAASAVGLGNLVAFPVMASKNGGAAFLIVYLFCIAFICYPVMMAEIAMGRRTQRNPVGAFADLSGGSRFWHAVGKIAILTPFMIAVFYTVITVWIVVYLARLVMGDLAELSEADAFSSAIAEPNLFIFLFLLLGAVFIVLLGGVKGGIEKMANFMLPALAVMLVLLTIFVLTLDNASAGIAFYLVPDFSKLNLAVLNGALSQAFFSLSLGMGILITYGSYFSREDSIPQASRMVAVADTSVAFIAGLFFLPAIFVFDPNTNPDDLSTSSVGLIFSFLPKIFLSMQLAVGYIGASIAAIVFFLLVFFAAFTSLVSIVEIPIAYLIDEWRMSRRGAIVIQAIALTVFTIPATMSSGISEFFTNFTSYGGATRSFFDLVSNVFYDTILPFVGFTVCIFSAYRWKMSGLASELAIGDEKFLGSLSHKYINLALGTIIPLILLAVFISTVNQIYFGG